MHSTTPTVSNEAGADSHAKLDTYTSTNINLLRSSQSEEKMAVLSKITGEHVPQLKELAKCDDVNSADVRVDNGFRNEAADQNLKSISVIEISDDSDEEIPNAGKNILPRSTPEVVCLHSSKSADTTGAQLEFGAENSSPVRESHKGNGNVQGQTQKEGLDMSSGEDFTTAQMVAQLEGLDSMSDDDEVYQKQPSVAPKHVTDALLSEKHRRKLEAAKKAQSKGRWLDLSGINKTEWKKDGRRHACADTTQQAHGSKVLTLSCNEEPKAVNRPIRSGIISLKGIKGNTPAAKETPIARTKIQSVDATHQDTKTTQNISSMTTGNKSGLPDIVMIGGQGHVTTVPVRATHSEPVRKRGVANSYAAGYEHDHNSNGSCMRNIEPDVRKTMEQFAGGEKMENKHQQNSCAREKATSEQPSLEASLENVVARTQTSFSQAGRSTEGWGRAKGSAYPQRSVQQAAFEKGNHTLYVRLPVSEKQNNVREQRNCVAAVNVNRQINQTTTKIRDMQKRPYVRDINDRRHILVEPATRQGEASARNIKTNHADNADCLQEHSTTEAQPIMSAKHVETDSELNGKVHKLTTPPKTKQDNETVSTCVLSMDKEKPRTLHKRKICLEEDEIIDSGNLTFRDDRKGNEHRQANTPAASANAGVLLPMFNGAIKTAVDNEETTLSIRFARDDNVNSSETKDDVKSMKPARKSRRKNDPKRRILQKDNLNMLATEQSRSQSTLRELNGIPRYPLARGSDNPDVKSLGDNAKEEAVDASMWVESEAEEEDDVLFKSVSVDIRRTKDREESNDDDSDDDDTPLAVLYQKMKMAERAEGAERRQQAIKNLPKWSNVNRSDNLKNRQGQPQLVEVAIKGIHYELVEGQGKKESVMRNLALACGFDPKGILDITFIGNVANVLIIEAAADCFRKTIEDGAAGPQIHLVRDFDPNSHKTLSSEQYDYLPVRQRQREALKLSLARLKQRQAELRKSRVADEMIRRAWQEKLDSDLLHVVERLELE